jgi:hypothetical protein
VATTVVTRVVRVVVMRGVWRSHHERGHDGRIHDHLHD